MKIFVLTPIYATTTGKDGVTPVVHYFTREWAKMGNEVVVFHFIAKYPKLMYWVGKQFYYKLSTRLGMMIPTQTPIDDDYDMEGVKVHRRCLKKVIPHSRCSKQQLMYALNCIDQECEQCGVPDWFVGHWDNPQLELLGALKARYGKRTCIVLHSNDFNFEAKYKADGLRLLSTLDIVGFRSPIGLQNYEKKYGRPKHTFVASSGVSATFLEAGKSLQKTVGQPANFIYVGTLIERKHPAAVLAALARVYPEGNFTLTYIGDGAEKEHIEKLHCQLGNIGVVRFTGRIPREEVIKYLKEADVFVMISKGEIFGLVYLEAMALGLVPIGSKKEGIDGIIHDGENGFLCEAGNVDELTSVLRRIKDLTTEQLEMLSQQAKKTANVYSDANVAKSYIDYLLKYKK